LKHLAFVLTAFATAFEASALASPATSLPHQRSLTILHRSLSEQPLASAQPSLYSLSPAQLNSLQLTALATALNSLSANQPLKQQLH
jgi:hypothetical protein